MDDQHLRDLRKDAREKMDAFQRAMHDVVDSGQTLFADTWSDVTAATYQGLSDAYDKTKAEMDEALRLMHEKTLENAGVPKDHPAWIWARKR